MTLPQATQIVFDLFNIKGIATQLPGEIDLNFLITVTETEKYVFKVEGADRDLTNLALQNEALRHLTVKDIPVELPKVIANKNGKRITLYTTENEEQVYLRLLTYLEGRLLAKVNPHSTVLLENLGATCGHLCQGLKDFDHVGAHRYFKWDNSNVSWVKAHLAIFDTPEEKALVQYFLTLFQTDVEPILPTLRKSVNYNDANDYNVLVNENLANPQISGLIDFGDVVYTHTINEVAIAAAYALMGKVAPLDAACEILKGFHETFPITEKECKVIFPLIAARLIISITAC